jgi:tol-pal system protein YbgF
MKRHAGYHAPRLFKWAGVAGVFFALSTLPIGPAGFAQGKKGGSGDTEVQRLRQRVEQLEEQLVDLRVVIGTLQSLAKAPAQGVPAAAPGYQGGGGDGGQGGRLSILETQIRALSAQVARLNERVKTLAGGAPAAGGGTPQGGASGGFGSTTVRPQSNDNGDRIGNFITRHVTPGGTGQQGGGGAGGQAAQEQFDIAYNAWLQGEVGKAQEGFRAFLNANPGHKLEGEALYWLGETYYQQQNYNKAAKTFLKVSRSFESSRLAPDSLYKLALSLMELGHTKAACTTLEELPQRYPQAPWGVLRKAASHLRRLGC